MTLVSYAAILSIWSYADSLYSLHFC